MARQLLHRDPSASRAGHYDAVVIGAGHNGLIAATYLARAGLAVLVLERRERLGGASVSVDPFPGVEAHLSRYSYLVSLLPQLIVRELGLDLRLARRRVSSYTPDPRVGGARGLLVEHGDAAATAASFEAVAGAGALAGWQRFYEMTARVARAVFPTLTEPLRSRAQLRARIGEEGVWRELFEEPLGAAVARALPDDLLAGVALTDALIGTFASAADPDLRQNRCFLYHVIGRCSGDWLVPVGGMGTLATELAKAARGAGAELRKGAEVLAVEAHRDHVEVRFEGAHGELAVRARHVLGAIAPAELERLCGAAPGELELERAGEGDDAVPARPEGSQLKLNMLLARLPRLRERGLEPERAFAGTFHVNESAQQLQRAYEQAAAGAIPQAVPCECYCHSLTDASVLGPQLRAAGAHTLTVFALHMPARLFRREGAKALAVEATLASLNSVLAEPIEDCLMLDADGRPCLEARTPLELEAELGLPGGNIFHRELSWPFAELPEEVGRWGVETDRPNVWICGAGARRGGGVSGIPGHNAAMAVLAA